MMLNIIVRLLVRSRECDVQIVLENGLHIGITVSGELRCDFGLSVSTRVNRLSALEDKKELTRKLPRAWATTPTIPNTQLRLRY